MIVERHGIKGLAVGTSTSIRFATPAAVVDVGIAHFGKAPTVKAYTDGKVVAEATVDERQRQTENARLSGKRIDHLTITSRDGTAILSFVQRPARDVAKAGREMTICNAVLTRP